MLSCCASPNLCATLIVIAALMAGCAFTPAQRAAKALARGKEAMAKKEYQRAALQFRIAGTAAPKDPEPVYQLALVYLEVGDLPGGVGYLQKACQMDPKHVPAQAKLAEIMALNPDVEVVREAEQRARQAWNSARDNLEAINALAMAELRLGKVADGEAHLREALAQAPQSLQSSTLLAVAKLSRNDRAGAEEVLQKAIAAAPKSADALVLLARLYLFTGRKAEAESPLRRALAIDPKSGPALLDLANIQYAAERKEEAAETCKRMSALPGNRYRLAYAGFLFQEGRSDAAVAELERLSQANPKDREIRSRLVSTYLSLRRAEDAEKRLNAALKQNTKDVEALLQRAEIHLLVGQFDKARADVNQVLQFKPDSAPAHYLLALIQGSQGSRLNHRHELSQALQLDPALLPARIQLAKSLIEAGDPRGALELMNTAPDTQRNVAAAIIQRNWALLALGDLEGLQKGIAAGLAQAARSSDLQLQNALLSFRQKKTAVARGILIDLLKREQGNLRALDVLAQSYAVENQNSSAVEKVREYAAKQPKSAALQQYLGQWLLATGNQAEARTALNNAKAADPSFVAVDFALAELDLVAHQYDSARQTLTRILDGNQNNAGARVLLGMVEEATGNFPAAITHYRKVAEAEPDNVIALNNLAYRLANDANLPDEALKHAQRAKELAPDNPAVQDTLGWAYYQKGLYQTALQYLMPAVAKAQNPVRMCHLSMAYFKLGDARRGRQVLEAALKMSPNLPEAALAQAVARESSRQ